MGKVISLEEYMALPSYEDLVADGLVDDDNDMDDVLVEDGIMSLSGTHYELVKTLDGPNKQQVAMFPTRVEKIDNRMVVCNEKLNGRYNAISIGDTEAKLFRINEDTGVIEKATLQYSELCRDWLREVATRGKGSLFVIGEDSLICLVLDI